MCHYTKESSQQVFAVVESYLFMTLEAWKSLIDTVSANNVVSKLVSLYFPGYPGLISVIVCVDLNFLYETQLIAALSCFWVF